MVLCGFASGYPLSRAKKKSNILRTGLLVQRAAEWVEIEGIAPVHMRENKELRAWNCVPLWRLNRVWLPTPDGDQYKWMHDYLQELLNFPDAAYDDQVDATTLAFNHLRGKLFPRRTQTSAESFASGRTLHVRLCDTVDGMLNLCVAGP